MTRKYVAFDRKLFAWLRGLYSTKAVATTANAIIALDASNNETLKRHISRRFGQLEDRGVIKCTLKGTTRICEVVTEIPVSISKQHWREGIARSVAQATGETRTPSSTAPSIQAADSAAYEAAGGTIERIPTNWDRPFLGSKPLGDSFSFDD